MRSIYAHQSALMLAVPICYGSMDINRVSCAVVSKKNLNPAVVFWN